MLPWRTEDMTPQQRANWALLQSVLEQEFERGFKRGLEVGRVKYAPPERLTEDDNAECPDKAIDIPRPVL